MAVASVPLSTYAQECGEIPLPAGAVHACVTGEGPVTVVLAAGAGQTSRTWNGIVASLASSARVVTFDRPGLGESPPSGAARTPTQIADELHAVVAERSPSGPLILVGHSMGGVHVLRYATSFPERVAGVVILDTPPPGFEEARLELLSEAERTERQRVLRRGLESAPEVVRLEREAARSPAEWEFAAFPDSLPLAVVVADAQDFGELGSQAAHRRLWLERSREWLELSLKAELTVAHGSGHMVHHDRPDIVLDHVRAMIAGDGPSTPPGTERGHASRDNAAALWTERVRSSTIGAPRRR